MSLPKAPSWRARPSHRRWLRPLARAKAAVQGHPRRPKGAAPSRASAARSAIGYEPSKQQNVAQSTKGGTGVCGACLGQRYGGPGVALRRAKPDHQRRTVVVECRTDRNPKRAWFWTSFWGCRTLRIWPRSGPASGPDPHGAAPKMGPKPMPATKRPGFTKCPSEVGVGCGYETDSATPAPRELWYPPPLHNGRHLRHGRPLRRTSTQTSGLEGASHISKVDEFPAGSLPKDTSRERAPTQEKPTSLSCEQ